jgi:hypothetical protein
LKSSLPNAFNAVGYGYAGKVVAVGKSFFPNTGNAVPYGYAGKAGTLVESELPNAGNAVWYSVTVFLCLLTSTLYYS